MTEKGHNGILFRQVMIAALQGSAALSATRHDCPPAKLVVHAARVAEEAVKLLEEME